MGMVEKLMEFYRHQFLTLSPKGLRILCLPEDEILAWCQRAGIEYKRPEEGEFAPNWAIRALHARRRREPVTISISTHTWVQGINGQPDILIWRN